MYIIIEFFVIVILRVEIILIRFLIKNIFMRELTPIGLLRSNLIDRNLIIDDKFLYKIDSLKKIEK